MTYEEALAVATANNEIDENQTFLIDKNLRTVTIPDGFVLGVFNDKNVQIVPFAMPRYYNGIDMSLFAIQINYVNSNGDGDIYLVFEKDVQDDLILFNWVVDRTAFATTGRTGFVVCMKEDDEYGYVEREFNTTLTYAPVLEGLEIENPIDDQTAMDILTQIIQAANRADEAADDAEASSNSAGASASNASSSASSASTSASNASASATAAAASAATASSAETNAVSARDAAIEAASTATEAAAELSTGAAIPNALFNKTAWSDDIVKIYDGADGVPIRSLVAEFTPVQDLHGQANPYPAGGGKNLLQNTLTSSTNRGVTATVNADGTVTLTGTNDGSSYSLFVINNFYAVDGVEYILSGAVSANILLRNLGAAVTDTGNGVSFTGNGTSQRIEIRVLAGTSISGSVVVKPMIRRASISDNTYAPYENICPISGRTGANVVMTGVNVLPFPYSNNSKTVNGVTFTVNSDGSITVTGTPTDTASFVVLNNVSNVPDLNGKTVTISGCPSGGNTSTYYLSGYRLSNGGETSVSDTGNSKTFVWSTGTYTNYNIAINIKVGTVIPSNGLTFYPQIELGSTANPYAPYQGTTYPISWQTEAGTVYGGTLDVVSGVLTVDRKYLSVKWSDFTSKTSLGDYTRGLYNFNDTSATPVYPPSESAPQISNIAPYKAAYSEDSLHFYASGISVKMYLPTGTSDDTDIEVCYQLATPQVIQLSPTEIKTLKDFNQIYTDIGKITVNYIADTEDAATDVMYKALVTDSASGNIAAFEDGAGNAPLESLVSQITPIQDLNGQSNPYPPGGGKNLLNNTASSQTATGITWTVNSDGTVTANGTATAETQFGIDVSATDLPRETNLYFSGCPSGGSATKYNVYVLDLDTNAMAKKWNNITAVDNDTGASANNELYLVSGHSYRVICRVMSGQTVSNLVFKPMIRLASVTDGTYAPYTNICPISGRTGLTVTAAGKNLLAYPYTDTTKTSNGVTFTDNGDGSITLSDTATAQTDYLLESASNDVLPPNAQLLLSGGISDNIYVRCPIDSRTFTSRGADIALTTTDGNITGNCFIRVLSGTNCNGVTVKPMIRVAGTSDTYEPHHGTNYPISWQTEAGTIYGGALDVVSGVLTVDRAIITLDGTQTIGVSQANPKRAYVQIADAIQVNASNQTTEKSVICDRLKSETWAGITGSSGNLCCSPFYGRGVAFRDDTKTTAADWTTYFQSNPTQFSYKLDTPQTYNITPTEIRSLLGGNTIYSDAGSVSVDYRADTKLYINKKIAEALA